MFDLESRVALITGAGRGVGEAIARTLAERGAAVLVNDLSAERATSVAASLQEAGHSALACVADVTDAEALAASVRACTAVVGPVDILINNAGIPASGLGMSDFTDSDPAGWDRMITLNLKAVLISCHMVLPAMIDRSWGRIVNIVSDAGRVGAAGFAVYSAAKAGAAGFSRSLALEVGKRNVTVNCVSLGSIEGDSTPTDPATVARMTARYPRRRLGRGEDVAAAVLWLASPEADWVTGQTIVVNGGFATS